MQIWGNEITTETGALASKGLFWGYSAALAGRFGENEIAPGTATLSSKCLFWGYFAAPAARFGVNEITPETSPLASKGLFWGYSAALAGRFGENEIAPGTATLFSMPVLVLFCVSCREIWGKWKKNETATLASKCMFWRYFAAPAGRFVENEITPKTATLAPKSLFAVILRLLPGVWRE
jgi:hypothetical protein